MKCLSIQQPWAQYIATGIKDVENRSWSLKTFPQRVLIHTGKKRRVFAPEDMPLLWNLIIENAESLGIVPFPEEMPTGAIIGVGDIVGCTVNGYGASDWNEIGTDEHPIYNLVFDNVKLFKHPILDVKGKQGIFEYADITDDNLPECVDIPAIHRKDKELFIPLHPESIDNIIAATEEELTFDYNLLENNLDLFAFFDGDEAIPIPTSHITFFCDDKKVRLKVTEAAIIQMTDNDDNPIQFTNPQGDELYWVKISYRLATETT